MESVNLFSHQRGTDIQWVKDGLRNFFEYADLGVKSATGGRVLCHLTRAAEAPVRGTGWHYHGADFHIVYVLEGWVRFMYEDKDTLVLKGDCVHQRPGIIHYLYDYSPDMLYLEVVGPADYTSIEVDYSHVAVPQPRAYI